MVANFDRPGEGGASDDGAGTGEGEAAINRQAKTASLLVSFLFCGSGFEMAAERRNTIAGGGRNRKNWRVGQCRTGEQFGNFVFCLILPVHRSIVDLGQCHRTALDAEQFNDRQMLSGLRHRSIVGGNDEQREVDPGSTGKHVVDQLFMAGNIDETEFFGIGIAEVDRDASRLLFFQAVAINAGQGFDQRCFAVIDMAGGADDHACYSGSRTPPAASSSTKGL